MRSVGHELTTAGIVSALEAKGFNGHPVTVSAVQRRRAQAGAGTTMQISYVVLCGDNCASVVDALADASSGTTFAAAISLCIAPALSYHSMTTLLTA